MNQICQLRQAQLYIAEEIKRVCKNNGISFFLDCGSMLGAVRHKGFIPWDDDMDIGMTKENYDHFIAIASDQLRDDFFIDNGLIDPKYPFVFSKVRLKGTVYIEKKGSKKWQHNEIFVDIFPYFFVPDEYNKWKIDALLLWFPGQALLYKAGCKVWSGDSFIKRFKYIPAILVGSLLSFETLRKLIAKYSSKYYNTNYYCILDGSYKSYRKWIIPKELFEAFIEVDFEGHKFPIPVRYHEYLTITYGDYQVIPPKEKQVTHLIEELDLGEYFF